MLYTSRLQFSAGATYVVMILRHASSGQAFVVALDFEVSD